MFIPQTNYTIFKQHEKSSILSSYFLCSQHRKQQYMLNEFNIYIQLP